MVSGFLFKKGCLNDRASARLQLSGQRLGFMLRAPTPKPGTRKLGMQMVS